MAVQLAKHSVTIEEFDRMVEAIVFGPGARVELIKGEILDMSPVSDRHLGCVMLLDALFQAQLIGKANVLVQSPVRMADDTKPYPDLCLLKWRKDYYTRKAPSHEDVLLVVEVADSSLLYDLRRKTTVYANAGIPEYWVIDLHNNRIEVFREPVQGKYQYATKAGPGDTLALSTDLDCAIVVDEILA